MPVYALRLILASFVIFILQATLVSHISIGGAAPDLVTILLVVLIIERGPVFAIIIGFLLGFMQDLGNASFLGMNALAKSIIAYGVSRVGGDYLPESVLFKGLLILAACLVNDIIVLNITSAFSFADVLVSFFRYSILSAVYSAGVGMLIIEFLKVLSNRMVHRGARY